MVLETRLSYFLPVVYFKYIHIFAIHQIQYRLSSCEINFCPKFEPWPIKIFISY